jgi:hypothetical protein
MRRTFVFVMMTALAAVLGFAAPAAASYGARSAPLLWEQLSWSYLSSGVGVSTRQRRTGR